GCANRERNERAHRRALVGGQPTADSVGPRRQQLEARQRAAGPRPEDDDRVAGGDLPGSEVIGVPPHGGDGVAGRTDHFDPEGACAGATQTNRSEGPIYRPESNGDAVRGSESGSIDRGGERELSDSGDVAAGREKEAAT